MAQPLSRLRRSLDIMPSPVPDKPGLLIRDPYGYAKAVLIIPPPLVPCVALFDGRSDERDLRQALVRATGELDVGELMRHLVDTLGTGGFLENEAFESAKEARHREFAAAPAREPAHAGAGYPEEASALRETLARYFDGEKSAAAPSSDLFGIAAPHVSPDGGYPSYVAAYAKLAPGLRGRTFVILGTSHYGEPDRFGLTRKVFRTPLGEARVEAALVDRLAQRAAKAVRLEDYCHAIEHSIEFQVVFLQHLFGGDIRILPILCGPFAQSLLGGGKPEEAPSLRRFFDALGELQASEGERLFWVLGVDLAHIGRRYGDRFGARADVGRMKLVARRDQERLARVAQGDADGFWQLVQENGDELRWCGSSALYTFLRAMAPAKGEVLRYDQWNIDAQSVVSFAGLAFSRS